MKMVLKSSQFNDVYFSADDGMAETYHVFLEGNALPQAWKGRERFTIAETGFGTGLNFLCAWKLFEETASVEQRLDFVSVEKYPLSKEQIRTALDAWKGDLGDYCERFLSLYPLRVPGPHKIHLTDRVSLTVWFGDIADIFPEWDMAVDAWFLDGFTPAKNPEMWTEDLFNHMARLSHSETYYATFTAAGSVRRGLENAGFSVEKTKGFGRKREMIRGVFKARKPRGKQSKRQSVAIIGGGLAGTALAHCLVKSGLDVALYEAGATLASGASGGRLGMINPKLTAKPTPHSDYYTMAYAYALRVLSQLQGIDFSRHGSLHLCTDADKERRFNGYIDNLGWHEDHIVRQGKDLFYPDGASVSPMKLCHVLVEGADIILNHPVENLNEIEADLIILANGFAVSDFLEDELPVYSVRGQVSWIKKQNHIDHNICFGGYITPETDEGFHVLGSSFQPWNTTCEVTKQDHKDNLERYNATTFDGHQPLSMDDIVGGWAALRTSSKDRFPIVGHVRENIYISTAHGSHGIISSLMAAEILTNLIQHEAVPVSRQVLKALSPERFRKC